MAPKLGVVFGLAAALGLAACERGPVVAGTVRMQGVDTSMAGGAGAAGAAGEEPQSAGGGGMAGGAAGASAGMGGLGGCTIPWWVRDAVKLTNNGCRFPETDGALVGFLLQAIIPWPPEQGTPPPGCGVEHWAAMFADGKNYFTLCDPLCSMVKTRLAEERAQINECLGLPPPGAP